MVLEGLYADREVIAVIHGRLATIEGMVMKDGLPIEDVPATVFVA